MNSTLAIFELRMHETTWRAPGREKALANFCSWFPRERNKKKRNETKHTTSFHNYIPILWFFYSEEGISDMKKIQDIYSYNRLTQLRRTKYSMSIQSPLKTLYVQYTPTRLLLLC